MIHLSFDGVDGGAPLGSRMEKGNPFEGQIHNKIEALEKCETELIFLLAQMVGHCRLWQFLFAGRFGDSFQPDHLAGHVVRTYGFCKSIGVASPGIT